MKPPVRKTLYWSAFLTLGPITGPLAEGAVRNWRKGERILAALYVAAIGATYVALPGVLAATLEQYQHLTR